MQIEFTLRERPPGGTHLSSEVLNPHLWGHRFQFRPGLINIIWTKVPDLVTIG